MKYTSAEASKLLKKLEEQKDILLDEEVNRCIYNCALGEKQEDVIPEYDFDEMQEKLNKIDGQIRKVKHALNVFNMTTMVPEFDMTIDQLLVYIPQLTQKKNRMMKMQSRQPKKRNENMSLKNGVIDYIYTNYDVAAARQLCEETSDLLRRAQLALDQVNNSEYIEIEL